MDTPITISSTSSGRKRDFLQQRQNTAKHYATISPNYERVPISWHKSAPLARIQTNNTLSNIQKVTNWIKSIEGDNRAKRCAMNDSGQLDSADESPVLTSKKRNQDTEISASKSKSLILVRCDFNKSVSAKTYYPPRSSQNSLKCSTPFMKYLANENVHISSKPTKLSTLSQQTTDINNTTSVNKPIKKNLALKRPEKSKLFNYQLDRKFSIDKNSFPSSKVNDEKSDASSEIYEVPLSPESRKKELCSYLQLMNPADKKEIFILQNRRSTRVKNLAAIQEKKQQEKKILDSEEKDDKLSDQSEKCVTLKSFKELNIKVEKVNLVHSSEDGKPGEIEKDSFLFPFPPKYLTETISDFDIIMSKVIPRLKRRCRFKKIKFHSINKASLHLPKKKENLLNTKTSQKYKLRKKNANLGCQRKLSLTNNILKNQKLKVRNLRKEIRKKKKISERSCTLRSNGKLKNVTLKKLLRKKEKEMKDWKNLKKKELRENHQKIKDKLKSPRKSTSSEQSRKSSKSKSLNSQCEIVSVPSNFEDDNTDFENFMDDMIDFNNLSEEHKKCLIESRILSTKPTNVSMANTSSSFYSIDTTSPLYGFTKSDVVGAQKICENYKILKHERNDIARKVPLEKEPVYSIEIKNNSPIIGGNCKRPSNIKYEVENSTEPKNIYTSNAKPTVSNGINLQEHDYAGSPNKQLVDDENVEVDVTTVPCKNLPVDYFHVDTSSLVKKNKYELLPYNKSVELKSLHKSLQFNKKKNNNMLAMDAALSQEWDNDGSTKQKVKKQSHYISISKDRGSVLKAFYIDYNLIICQEYNISFWMQTPLGNVLGSQNMWIPRGEISRLTLNNKCIQKESMEMIICMETNVAYIELWTKEHKSDIRQGPVADVFVTLYFWRQNHKGLDKKVLQLENINGFADDVQYSVMKCLPKIIVSWHSANEDNVSKRTFIHAYQLAPDYQTVSNIYDIEPIDHYVSSLHNIEDCENLIMGCGDNKVTLWNVEFGYVIATIELTDIKSPLSTLWVKCDRGFLFALQQCVDRELRLIAINGINHSWKKLASYFPPEGFDRLRGVCIENGLLLSFYDQGILCWKAETGEPVEEISLETDLIPSGKYVILLEDNQIFVKHAMTHLMSMSVEDT